MLYGVNLASYSRSRMTQIISFSRLFLRLLTARPNATSRFHSNALVQRVGQTARVRTGDRRRKMGRQLRQLTSLRVGAVINCKELADTNACVNDHHKP
jgi:hypothetical protein